jgi:hypothetical protein
VTLGAKGRDTSAAAALAAAGALAGGACTALAAVEDFFADFFGALFLAFFFALRLGADFFALFFFFLPAAFLRADFLRFAPFFFAGFLRPAGFRAERLRLLFLRAAMCSLPRDAVRRRVFAILGSPRNQRQALACRECVSR